MTAEGRNQYRPFVRLHPSSLQSLPGLDGFIDRADHVKSLLRKIVVLAIDDFFEAGDRVFKLDVLAFAAGELRSDVERLREEFLNLARARHDQFIFIG